MMVFIATLRSTASWKAVKGLIEYAKKNAEGAMEDIDEMLDLGELEGGGMFYFASLA